MFLSKCINITLLFLISFCIFFPCKLYSASNHLNSSEIFQLSLEELLNVTVVSLFHESKLDTSSSVYIINEDEWLAKGVKRTNEIMSYQPGVTNLPTLGGSSAFSIRGFSNTLSVRGVATLLDGIPLNTYSFGTGQYSLANFDIGALQKAELIRGPGSAVHGSDAFNGVFAMQTFSADKDIVQTELGAGSPGYARFNTRFSHSFEQKHRINGGIAATHQSSSNIIFNDPNSSAQGLRQDAYTSNTAFITTESELNAQWSSHFGLYLNTFNSDDFPSFGSTAAIGPSTFLGINDISDSESKFYMFTAEVTRSLTNKKTLELKTFRWQTEQEFHYHFTGVPLQTQDDLRQGLSVTLKQPGGYDQTRWLIGAGVNKQDILSAQTLSGPQAFNGLNRDIKNFFSQVRIPLMNNLLALDMGARVDNYTDFGSQFTPRIALIYKPENNTAYKFLYGNAFRAPVGSELTESGRILGDPNLKPETIDTYELVYMNQTHNSSSSLTLFYSKWQDAIIIMADGSLPAPFTFKYVNQGVFNTRGLEAEYNIQSNAWSLDTNLSFTRSEDSYTNERFVAFPETLINLTLSYDMPTTNTVISFSNQAMFNVHSGTVQSSEKLATIWLSNLNIKYVWSPDMDIAIDIRDLFNRKDRVPSLWDNPEGLPSNGIEFAAYLRYKW